MSHKTKQRPKYLLATCLMFVLAFAVVGVALLNISRAITADVNGDGKVDITDLNILLTNYSLAGRTLVQGDIDGNGTVNIIDLSILLTNYGGGNGSSSTLPYQAPGKNYSLPANLIFDDEFNNSTLDKTTWAPVWFSNGSSQNGTTMNASNVSESGGFLVLHNSGNTGGLASTNPTAPNGQAGYHGFQYTLGYAEARICLPAASNGAVANWPAWWTDGQNWPGNGEQDIMEGLSGNAQAHWHGSISTNSGIGYGNGGHLTGCHIFASLWQLGKVTSYYDGVQLGSYSSSEIVASPHYLIVENSVGQWGNQPTTDNTDVKVDYVRVWQ